MLNDNQINVRFRLSHIRFSIFPVTGLQLVDRQVDRRQTALHRTSYFGSQGKRAVGRGGGGSGGGGEETLKKSIFFQTKIDFWKKRN